jgi:LysM repeat protein
MHMKTSLMSFKAGVSKNKEERRVIANWGDTLWSLAEDYDVSPDEIRRANNLSQVFSLPTGPCYELYSNL